MTQFISPSYQQAYFEAVWAFVRQVPHGKVVTYGQVAQSVAMPDGVEPETYKVFGSRWVGGAMAACPTDVPWQRVINSQGKISQRSGAQTQRLLLEEEGILFVNGKVNLKVYRWRGPGQEGEIRQLSLF